MVLLAAQGFSHTDVAALFLAVAVLLGCARIAAEIAQLMRQPAVLGEILAGILLGPTVFGALMPEAQSWLFPQSGAVANGLEALSIIAISLFLLVAGMEIDLSMVWRQGKNALVVGLFGILVPFVLGFVPAYFAPGLMGALPDSNTMVFALFVATAMSITALPVIVKILLDLRLFQTDLGITIVAAAVLNDLVGWIIFAFVLAMMGAGGEGLTPSVTMLLTVVFTVVMLTFGRWGVNRVLPWIQAHTEWPGGVLGFALTCTMLCAAFTEWIGVHAIFGAFIFGVALGDSAHLRRRTRATIEQFVSFVFAPLFFASIGLKADFVQNFDLGLVVLVLAIACVGKIVGCTFAARWMGFGKGESRAIGFGMNARGAMEIILGLLALEAGLIGEKLFVALVVMALATSMGAGVLIQRSFGKKRQVSLLDFVVAKSFVADLEGADRIAAVDRLARVAAEAASVDADVAAAAVLARERAISGAMGHGLAIPHARLAELEAPIVAIGLSRAGIDFDASDGEAVHVIVLILTPARDAARHLEILSSVARSFKDPHTAQRLASSVTNLTELRAFLRVEANIENAEH
ncbi:MAG: cation:proton antiporter [Phycisphaeraceae bacterium]|nr:cation:proton antiporter [Phycisphaeraceae bacterium]